MEAVIVKNSPASVVWKLIVEHSQLIACALLLGHNVYWWFNAPTVFTTVTFAAMCTFMAITSPRRWLVWAWIFLMLVMGAIHAATITQAEQQIVSKPIVVFCGKCEQ